MRLIIFLTRNLSVFWFLTFVIIICPNSNYIKKFIHNVLHIQFIKILWKQNPKELFSLSYNL